MSVIAIRAFTVLLGVVIMSACTRPSLTPTTTAIPFTATLDNVQPALVATNTPEPTPTAAPTNTSTPTNTPTLTPTPLPTPIGSGGLIAFTSVRIGSDYNRPATDIVLLDPNSGKLDWLTGGSEMDMNLNPAWSADGGRIVYIQVNASGNLGAGGKLRLFDINQSQDSEVDSPFGSGLYHPSWSAKDEIILSRSAARDYPQIWLADSQELAWDPITPQISFQFGPVWSPDGDAYAFSGSPGVIYSRWFDTVYGSFRLTTHDIPPRDIYVVDVKSGEMLPVVVREEDDFDPAWSPDAQKLAFVSVMDGNNPEIFVVNRDGTDLQRLTDNEAEDSHPTWSPDGTQIAFSSDRDGNHEIYMMHADGQDPVRMTDSLMDDLEPVWSPLEIPANLIGANSFANPAGYKPTQRRMKDYAESLTASGLLSQSNGNTVGIPDFDEKWAQMNWYSYYLLAQKPTNFMIQADASWDSASDKANWFNSGCGFVFREKDVDNHYLAYLDLDGVAKIQKVKNGYYSRVGVAPVRFPVEKPADHANLMLVVEGDTLYFFVDGYLMLTERDTSFSKGGLGLTLISGTNKGYGTHCKMTNIKLYTLE